MRLYVKRRTAVTVSRRSGDRKDGTPKFLIYVLKDAHFPISAKLKL